MTPDKIPAMLLTPNDWAAENIRLGAEYAGMPEGPIFAANARRFLALEARIKALESEVSLLEKIDQAHQRIHRLP